MNGMRRNELDCGMMFRGGIAAMGIAPMMKGA